MVVAVMLRFAVFYFVYASVELCDPDCKCALERNDVKVTCSGSNIIQVPTGLPLNTTKLYLSGTNIRTVMAKSFSFYHNLTEIFFRDTSSDPCQLEFLEPGVFDGLTNLKVLGMIGCSRLTQLKAGVLGTFHNLEWLHIYRSGLVAVPDLSKFRTINSGTEGMMREIDLHNNKIEKIRANDFNGVKTDLLKLEENEIKIIENFAFKDAKIFNLVLNKNTVLQEIQENAFESIGLINKLDLSYSRLKSLPTRGLANLRHLVLKGTPSLKHFPSVLDFNNIETAELTYPHHCCAFENPEKQNPSAWLAMQAQERINRECALMTTAFPIRDNEHITVPESANNMFLLASDTYGQRISIHRFKRNIVNKRQTLLNENDADMNNGGFGEFGNQSVTQEKKIDPGIIFHKSTVAVDGNLTQNVLCGKLYVYNRNITCVPKPDAFNPCEDVMGYVWLRVIVWFVLLAALLGNSVVLLVLTTSRGKFTVPKFLMCNLAFADFLMGAYLILLASIDVHTLGEYFNYAVMWQNEGGCQAAGFLSVFSSELSIFTLTILTLERWYAISHAIHLNKRLKLRQSVTLMALGYTVAVILAVLPIVGVSGYGNVSICLPMKADNGVDIGFVVSLLVMNGVMFLAICVCYLSMYWKVKGSATTARSNDATIAKRMALLVFTNFACWAPIAFFGLTAFAGMPLIDITNSKILLVFFYPLNSCANPFLYAILTKQFRNDVFILLGKYGICVEKAHRYRGTFSSRTASQSRGNKDLIATNINRHSESIYCHITDCTNGCTSSNTVTHLNHAETTEEQPFIEKSHRDRAIEFANKEPILISDDSPQNTWDPAIDLDCEGDRPNSSYVRSISDYTQFSCRKSNSLKLRISLGTLFSSSTDSTYISKMSPPSPDEVWKIREENMETDGHKVDKKQKMDDGDKSNKFDCFGRANDEEIRLSHSNCYTSASEISKSDICTGLAKCECDNGIDNLSLLAIQQNVPALMIQRH